jgi:predicted amidohydrolase YtcJ
VGHDADLVILDRDPRTTPAAELANIRVMATFMAGQLRYTA